MFPSDALSQSKVGFLHYILGICACAKHAISEQEERPFSSSNCAVRYISLGLQFAWLPRAVRGIPLAVFN